MEVKHTIRLMHEIKCLNGNTVKGTFYYQSTEQSFFGIGKVLKRKAGKLFVKWKGFSFPSNSCSDLGVVFN